MDNSGEKPGDQQGPSKYLSTCPRTKQDREPLSPSLYVLCLSLAAPWVLHMPYG